jgi:hypothetical protein
MTRCEPTEWRLTRCTGESACDKVVAVKSVAAMALVVMLLASQTYASRASSVRMWVSPNPIAPAASAHVVVHLSGLSPAAQVKLFVSAPAPAHAYAAQTTAVAGAQGNVTAPISFAATDTGRWGVSAQWNGNSEGTDLIVRTPPSTKCSGSTAIPHVFSRQPELLIQGTVAKPGGNIWLLGIGYDPCSPVTFADAGPQADFAVAPQRTRTDRNGDFRIAFHIPKPWPASIIYVYPRVNTVDKPIAAIAVSHS